MGAREHHNDHPGLRRDPDHHRRRGCSPAMRWRGQEETRAGCQPHGHRKKAREDPAHRPSTRGHQQHQHPVLWVTFDGAARWRRRVPAPVHQIRQTNMPRVGDMWPAWYSPTDPNLFAVAMPDGASPEQIPSSRVRHPRTRWTSKPLPSNRHRPQVSTNQRLAQMKADGLLTDEEFAAAKAKLLGGKHSRDVGYGACRADQTAPDATVPAPRDRHRRVDRDGRPRKDLTVSSVRAGCA